MLNWKRFSDSIVMTQDSNKKRKGLLTGLVIGGAVGSVLSFLLTTKEGKDATKTFSNCLKKNGQDLLNKLKDSSKNQE
jgi:gas vesicle protein